MSLTIQQYETIIVDLATSLTKTLPCINKQSDTYTEAMKSLSKFHAISHMLFNPAMTAMDDSSKKLYTDIIDKYGFVETLPYKYCLGDVVIITWNIADTPGHDYWQSVATVDGVSTICDPMELENKLKELYYQK